MQMTKAERLLGIMLAEIMERLDINGEIDPTFVKKMLAANDTWAIGWRYSSLGNDEEPVSEDVVSETVEILAMMSFIEYSIGELSGEEAAEFADARRLKFHGFDGNNDPHFGVALTLIEDLGRFSEYAGRELNSHGSWRASAYRRLKPTYDAAMQGGMGNALSVEDLRALKAVAGF